MVFKIGINCDADSLFDKDPKDPRKYELEGSKAQASTQQMCDYYCKLCDDHPMLQYIEDPFAETDIAGFKQLKNALAESHPTVKIVMNSIFKSSRIEKV